MGRSKLALTPFLHHFSMASYTTRRDTTTCAAYATWLWKSAGRYMTSGCAWRPGSQ